jgi:hypothetical protein
MNKSLLITTLLSTSLLLTACGGGGHSDDDDNGRDNDDNPAVINTPDNDDLNTPPAGSRSTYLLKGTVPGTLIEAYCDDGSLYSVTSTQNGTSRHPFELSLPKNLPCRVVMITNENDLANKVVTPIKFIDQQGKTSIAITSNGGNIQIGHIDLSISRATINADGNNDGVEDIQTEVIVFDTDLEVIDKNGDPLDRDDDGIVNTYEDNDGDGISNHDDDDDDNDGILDIDDNDRDNDGLSDDDLDGDGVHNNNDVDDDNDGIHDSDDDDDDNDGIRDSDDDDDDNDGIRDSDDDGDHNGSADLT